MVMVHDVRGQFLAVLISRMVIDVRRMKNIPVRTKTKPRNTPGRYPICLPQKRDSNRRLAGEGSDDLCSQMIVDMGGFDSQPAIIRSSGTTDLELAMLMSAPPASG